MEKRSPLHVRCNGDFYMVSWEDWFTVSGVLYEQPGESFLRLAVITLGNLVCGVSFPLLEKDKAHLDET